MKVVVVITSLVALVYSSAIPNHGKQYYKAKFAEIRLKSEARFENISNSLQEDAVLLVPQIIKKYGYPIEVHTITSKDGYILEMHRIPYGREGPSENRPAVYLQHGILSSSADWILAGTEKGFAYILADAGYDVWMPNVRGTRYSRKHINLDPDKDAKKFWDFSWHEFGMDDVPTMVDYVIAHTKQKQIFYIAHSQGSTTFFVMCSQMPEYNNKFRAMFSLAPVSYMKHMTSPLLRIIALFDGPLEFLFKLIGLHEFLPTSSFFAQLGEEYCSDGSIFQILCTNSLFAICGFNPAQMNATLLPVIMGHTPAGASTKQLLHFSQEIKSGKFRQYDYGYFGNKKRYGKRKPPSYSLKKVTAPVYLFYSNNDWISHPKDVYKLYKELGNCRGRFVSPDNKFNHADYLYGIDAPKILYSRILGRMKKH